ncbi:MAG: porin [Rhizobiaceae bacterium]
MTLKALLLGSAAAMIAVSGARAADAVVAEPEAVEYVKVCDTYGSGFYYIPGTETCLSINGYARVEYIYTSTNAGSTGAFVYRARVNFDARNETDYGTLRSQIRIQGDGAGRSLTTDSGADTWGNGDANAYIDRALISIGGLQFGYSDSFFTTNHGYGWQRAANDGYYSYDQAIMLQYTYAANGFSATVGIQDSVGSTTLLGNGAENPDLYVGASYAASWGRVAASYIHDTFNDASAWKVSADLNVIEGVGIHGWYAGNNGSRFATGYVGTANDYEFGVDVSYQVSSDLNVWVGYTDADLAPSAFAVGAHWNPVPGLSVRPEAVFFDNDTNQYRLRVVRSF